MKRCENEFAQKKKQFHITFEEMEKKRYSLDEKNINFDMVNDIIAKLENNRDGNYADPENNEQGKVFDEEQIAEMKQTLKIRDLTINCQSIKVQDLKEFVKDMCEKSRSITAKLDDNCQIYKNSTFENSSVSDLEIMETEVDIDDTNRVRQIIVDSYEKMDTNISELIAYTESRNWINLNLKKTNNSLKTKISLIKKERYTQNKTLLTMKDLNSKKENEIKRLKSKVGRLKIVTEKLQANLHKQQKQHEQKLETLTKIYSDLKNEMKAKHKEIDIVKSNLIRKKRNKTDLISNYKKDYLEMRKQVQLKDEAYSKLQKTYQEEISCLKKRINSKSKVIAQKKIVFNALEGNNQILLNKQTVFDNKIFELRECISIKDAKIDDYKEKELIHESYKKGNEETMMQIMDIKKLILSLEKNFHTVDEAIEEERSYLIPREKGGGSLMKIIADIKNRIRQLLRKSRDVMKFHSQMEMIYSSEAYKTEEKIKELNSKEHSTKELYEYDIRTLQERYNSWIIIYNFY